MRLGDVFGTTVNRASRLTGIAHPGSVLVDDAIAGVAARRLGLRPDLLRRAAAARARRVRPWRLSRASADAAAGRLR